MIVKHSKVIFADGPLPSKGWRNSCHGDASPTAQKLSPGVSVAYIVSTREADPRVYKTRAFNE
jgi:hypothetical protein